MSALPARVVPAWAAPAVPWPALQAVGRAATAALHDELVLHPKPGLVSLVDSGSHVDMDAGTFMRSLFALRRYFPHIAAAGAQAAPWPVLQALGVAAEARMLAATGGINTHRGAVFLLGLLCAAAGHQRALGRSMAPEALRAALAARWGDALRAHVRQLPPSNGRRAAWRHGLRSAGDEAASGFPVLFDTAVPALRAARHAGLGDRAARLQVLFHIMATLDDTNLAHRGGLGGLRFAQQSARGFLAAGGAARPDAVGHALAIHRSFVARRLSPGGAADVLAATCLLDRLERR